MISREKLDELYDCVEVMRQRLFEIEDFWVLCSPCQNHGKCCHKSTTSATASEWAQIKKALITMNKKDKESVRRNIEDNYECPFRGQDKCFIHNVRPLVCRTLPYILMGGKEQGYAVVFGHGKCSDEERGGAILKLDIASDVDVVKIPIPPRPEGVYYAVGTKIQNSKIFKAMKKEPMKTVIEWLKKEETF